MDVSSHIWHCSLLASCWWPNILICSISLTAFSPLDLQHLQVCCSSCLRDYFLKLVNATFDVGQQLWPIDDPDVLEAPSCGWVEAIFAVLAAHLMVPNAIAATAQRDFRWHFRFGGSFMEVFRSTCQCRYGIGYWLGICLYPWASLAHILKSWEHPPYYVHCMLWKLHPLYVCLSVYRSACM